MTPLSIMLFAWALVCSPHSLLAALLLAGFGTLVQLAYAAGVGVTVPEA